MVCLSNKCNPPLPSGPLSIGAPVPFQLCPPVSEAAKKRVRRAKPKDPGSTRDTDGDGILDKGAVRCSAVQQRGIDYIAERRGD